MNVRINEEIREYCKVLRLSAIKDNFESLQTEGLSHEEYLHRLLGYEMAQADRRRIESRIRSAAFPYRKYLEDLELDCLPEAMRKRLAELSGLDFIREGRNLILTGNPGTGKTHTAIGLGIKACEAGYRVMYTTVPFLVTELKESRDLKKLGAYQRRFEKYDLVIADELGYISFDREGAELLFNNLSLRSAQKSTIITSNLTFQRWDEIFPDAAMTSAMVDRLTYKAILVDMAGDSYRLRETLRSNKMTFDALNAAAG